MPKKVKWIAEHVLKKKIQGLTQQGYEDIRPALGPRYPSARSFQKVYGKTFKEIQYGTNLDVSPKVFARLPATDRTMIHGFMRGRKQQDIAEDLGVTQANISLCYQSLQHRIAFLNKVTQLQDSDFQNLPPNLDVELLHIMWQTLSQSETARRLNKTQGYVRHRLHSNYDKLARLAQHKPEYAKLEQVMRAIVHKNLNFSDNYRWKLNRR